MANDHGSFDSLEAFRASERAALAHLLDTDGIGGATARALPVSHSFNDWAIEEARRGVGAEEIVRASSFLIASMIHDVAVNAAANSKSLKVRLVASILLDRIKTQLEADIDAESEIPIWPVKINLRGEVQS